MLGSVTVRRKAVASEMVTQADTFQWTVVFLSKVGMFSYGLHCFTRRTDHDLDYLDPNLPS